MGRSWEVMRTYDLLHELLRFIAVIKIWKFLALFQTFYYIHTSSYCQKLIKVIFNDIAAYTPLRIESLYFSNL